MAARADVVVVGEVTAKTRDRDDAAVTWTYTTFRVDGCLKGKDVGRAIRVTAAEEGGKRGCLMNRHDLALGERMMLFLEISEDGEYVPVAGWAAARVLRSAAEEAAMVHRVRMVVER